MQEGDLAGMAKINEAVFLGHRENVAMAELWLRAFFVASPLYTFYVVELDGVLAGYIGWQWHGGFLRAEPVVELEQLAISAEHQGQGLANRLIEGSFEHVQADVQRLDTRIESSITAVVWVYAHNAPALRVYERWFTDGVVGMRQQYGLRSELQLRRRMSWSKS